MAITDSEVIIAVLEGISNTLEFIGGILSTDGGMITFLTLAITLGIAIQNFPEGSALSLPLRNAGLSTSKSLFISFLSALVEPIAAFIGAFIVVKVQMVLPIILALAAGAMIYVTSMELIPECQSNKNNDFVTLLIILGFSIMMILEIILG
jgi:ZIP family zinc transporter